MQTQVVHGIHLPDWDTHFRGQIEKSPIVNGKGTYQYPKIVAALEIARRRRHAVDIGAHVGLWSRILANEFDQVTAFEPMRDHADCFELNLAGFPTVSLERYALGDGSGAATMTLPVVDIASARIDKNGEGVPVKMERLDTFGLRSVDFVKIDVEGFAVPVLLGGEFTIRRDKPVIVVEQKGRDEHFGVDRYGATELLKSWGARVALELKGDSVLTWDPE